ncbi:hypothetical protein ACFO3O_07400 [Dokdonia ponticola]|uniref:DUF306 domain-containing protein n=1 Tax=Dokdonia ponticola TaxID=2041041 RepID=A0ABV9HU95_9FLAO
MKLLISPFAIVSVIILISCGGQKKPMFEKEGTLTFQKATYSKWVAGVKGGGAGYTVNLQLDPKDKHIQLDSLYFEKYSTSLVGNGAGLYSGFIDNGQNKEILMPVYGEEQKVKEVPSPENIQTLFELTGNEAVVSYTQDGIIKYYKLYLTLDNTLEFPR